MKTYPHVATATSEVCFTTSRGHCAPYGATERPGGVNFVVFSRHAARVHLVLSRPGHEEPVAELPLDPKLNKTGDVWHIFVHDLTPDYLYGYRVFGPFAPQAGHRFNGDVVVLDPVRHVGQRRPPLGRSRGPQWERSPQVLPPRED